MNMKMNLEVKKLWLTALRSGEYTQGIGALNCDGKYCCLGVLCEIATNKGIITKIKSYDSAIMFYGGHCAILPHEAASWAQLEDFPECNIPPDKRRVKLSELNDSLDYNFNQIADVIEEQF